MATPSENFCSAVKSTFCVWNRRKISPPPTVTCSYVSDEQKEGNPEDYCELLSNIIPTSEYIDKFLASERFTLTRLLYKLHNQQNRFKWYQLMSKINKVVVRIENIKLTDYVKELKGCCNKISMSSSASVWHMCSCQMHQYFLVKLMSISKLCSYTTALCEKTAVFLVQFLSLGHMVSNNLVFCSLISRIWVLLQSLLSNTIKWYDKLYPWCIRLKATAVTWLPSDECLPESLSTWLASESLPVNLTKKSKTQRMLSKWFSEQDETNTSDTHVGLLDNTVDNIKLDTSSLIDLGEPVSVIDKELLSDLDVAKKNHAADKGEKHDAAQQPGDHRSKKKKKRKSKHGRELDNNNKPDDSCEHASDNQDQLKIDDESQEYVDHIKTDVSGLEDKDTVNIISSRKKKRKRKHNHGDVENTQVLKEVPASTGDAPTSKKKRNKTSVSSDKHHLSALEDNHPSPYTLKKVEEEEIKSTVDVDNGNTSCNESVKKKKKKKKRKLATQEPNINETDPSEETPSANIGLSSDAFDKITTDIISATLAEQEPKQIDTDVDGKAKKKKKKRKRKLEHASSGSEFSKTSDLTPVRKIKMDITEVDSFGNNEKQSELSHKKKKRKSGQIKPDMSGLESLTSGGTEISHQDTDAGSSQWHKTSQIRQDSEQRNSRRKRQSDPVLADDHDQDVKIMSGVGDSHQAHIVQYIDDHREVLQGKKSKKKKRKKKHNLQEQSKSSIETTVSNKSDISGQIKHQRKKKKAFKSDVADIDDIFSALE